MEVSCNIVVDIPFKDDIKLANYKTNSSARPHIPQQITKPILRSTTSQNHYKFSSLKDIPKLQTVRVSYIELGEETSRENRDTVNRSANEMINVCYAKMWRGAANSLQEDSELGFHNDFGNISASFYEKDLDKLKKLRRTSRSNSWKYTDRSEVKKWCETAEKFISTLTDIRERKGSVVNNEDTTNNTGHLIAGQRSPEKNKNQLKNQVHFPANVLLCSALQDDDHCEVQRIIKWNKIDLNSHQFRRENYLRKCITSDKFECARTLIECGVDVNRKDGDGVLPIALAFRLMNLRMVALLVESGANLTEYTKNRVEELGKAKQLASSISKVFEMEV